jgi:hypothetical protein
MKTKFHSRFVGAMVAIVIAGGLGGAVSTATSATVSAQPAIASVQPEGFTVAQSIGQLPERPFFPHCERGGCGRPEFQRHDGWREPWYRPMPPRFGPFLRPFPLPLPIWGLPRYVPQPVWEQPEPGPFWDLPPCGCHY